MIAYNGNTVTYDAIGNPLTYYNGFSFTWEKGRVLSSVTNGTDTVTYVYDHEGNRKEKTVNGVTSTFMVEGGLVKYVRTGNKGTWYYYDAGGAPVGVALGSPIRRYLYRKDLQGDITGIYSGNTGELLVSYVYDAWGKPEITDEAQTEESAELIARNCLLYRGYFYDHETGLYYLRSRYYDPEVGRFINADVFVVNKNESGVGGNLFSYCFNNPISLYDNTGRLPEWIEDALEWINGAVSDIVEDIVNFDITNQSEEKALQSHFFSIYKGAPIVRIGGNRSFSFGVIFLTKESNERPHPEDVVRHEYGHTIQLKLMGPIKYAIYIGIPSALDLGDGDYYDKPWEVTAEALGNVQYNHHSTTKYVVGFVYLMRSIIRPVGYRTLIFTNKIMRCIK